MTIPNAVVLKLSISICHGLDPFHGEHFGNLELCASASAAFGKKTQFSCFIPVQITQCCTEDEV